MSVDILLVTGLLLVTIALLVTEKLPVDVATFLLNEKREVIGQIQGRHGIEVTMVPNPYLETPHFEVVRLRADEVSGELRGRSSYELVSRKEPGAVLEQLNVATTQAVQLAAEGRVTSRSGDEIAVTSLNVPPSPATLKIIRTHPAECHGVAAAGRDQQPVVPILAPMTKGTACSKEIVPAATTATTLAVTVLLL